MSFDESFENTIGHEGGYSNHPSDRGGETKYGISDNRDGVQDGKSDVNGDGTPDVDIANMTIEQAKEIYRRDYWDKMRCDELPGNVADQLFDFAVNSGVGTAVRALQDLVGANVDGVIGDRTVDAVSWMDPEELGAKLLVKRCLVMLRAIAKRQGNAAFAGGWANRIEKQLELVS